MTYRALDLFCCAGGVSVGLERAGFEVVGVDINPQPHHRGGTFVQADALAYPLEGFDFVWASPPCQAHSALRSLNPGKVYPDLIPATRERLVASGTPYCIENVPGAPLGASGYLIMLCGTMFGLQTPDGRAELRRHRLFETSFGIPLRPACQHGYRPESLSVCGSGNGKEAERRLALSVMGHSYQTVDSHPDSRKRKLLCVAGGKAMSGGMMTPQGELKRRSHLRHGSTPQTNVVRNTVRETFSIADARAAMGINWMPMKYLSQAIPPAYAEWIGRQAISYLSQLASDQNRKPQSHTP